jgi:Domain of unknown function (DUF4389)
MTYPLHYSVERPLHFSRRQLLLRVFAFCLLGLLGLSFGAVLFAAYVLLPAFATGRLASGRTVETYAREDGASVLRALHWLAAVSAWAGLTADRLPSSSPAETVGLELSSAPPASSSPGAALWRLISGLPSAFALTVMCWVGTLVWLWAAISVLLFGRVGRGAFDYLVGLQRWSLRLLAYQAYLVAEYPPFTFDDSLPALPAARVHSA